ncbi:O-antigen polymerase [Facklamia sp. P12945]|uniref:O-antigen polymerase n=1 Tax=Facklamia sp. P12945 TaxID=3421950 RepID=UPI003D17D1D7
MNIFFQLLALFINFVIFLSTFMKLKNKLNIVYIILLLFQIIFVFPILLELILGVQDYSYKSPGFQKALTDITTNIIYSIFTIIIVVILYLMGNKRETTRFSISDIRETLSNLKIRREFYLLSVVLMFIPLIFALFSPSPEKYFTEYAHFQRFAFMATDSELWYHQNFMRIGGFISLIFILITKLFSKETAFNNFLIILATIITGILNGKRTLFALIVFAILSVDILKAPRGRFPIKKVVSGSLFILIFFLAYAFIIDKHTANVTTIDNLRLYFFRDVDVKFSIYALLNPKEYKMFDYWGQSYLYNILFYIPRSFWPNKPYPYDIYVTASALGYSPGTIISWNFQTSLFGEAISNLGWLGIPFSLFLLNKFIKISEQTKNPIIIVLCIFIIMFSYMNHFGAYRNYLIVWILLVLTTKFKIIP